MTLLTHITKLENEKSIRRSGIKLGDNGIIFFMPHLKDFLISHQWARELKRSNIKNFAAIDFRIPSEEEVWFGKYNSQHKKMKLGEAVSILMDTDPTDALGYEFFIDRKIASKEIVHVRPIAKPMGWRYLPKAHGTKPCPCPMCIQAGGFKTGKLKEVYRPSISRMEAKRIIETSEDESELWKAVLRLQGKWKRESPAFLERLLNCEDEYLLCDLVKLLSEFRHPLALDYLTQLTTSEYKDVREYAQKYL